MGLNPNLSPLGLNTDPFSALEKIQKHYSWQQVWQQVATDNAILKGFKECGYIRYDGDVNSLHSRLRDTIVNREIPPEVLAEVNEFLIQLEAERNETGGNLDELFKSEEDDNDEDTEDETKDDRFENDDVDIEVL